jgi:hypothetical protein
MDEASGSCAVTDWNLRLPKYHFLEKREALDFPSMSTTALPRQAVIREVGLRDGLQGHREDPADRTEEGMDRDAFAAGQREIEGRLVRAGPPCCRNWRTRPNCWPYAKTLPGLFASCWCRT